MADTADPRVLILETSQRLGWVALAQGEHIVGRHNLDEARRHARDLVPAVQALLAAQAWPPRSLDAVFVSRGPGSYTGLRVGLVSAKTLAYATGCTLLALDTFTALARQATPEAAVVDVIADAQQDRLYQQRFRRGCPSEPLTIVALADWRATLPEGVLVTGPGLEQFEPRLPPGTAVAERDRWFPQPASLLEVGFERWRRGERDDPFAVEPLYLRASSAEDKWRELGR